MSDDLSFEGQVSPMEWGKSSPRQIGITLGEWIKVGLRKAADDIVDTPDDIAIAFRQGGATASWDALSPGKSWGLLHIINTAKRADTRAKRIAKPIAEIS